MPLVSKTEGREFEALCRCYLFPTELIGTTAKNYSASHTVRIDQLCDRMGRRAEKNSIKEYPKDLFLQVPIPAGNNGRLGFEDDERAAVFRTIQIRCDVRGQFLPKPIGSTAMSLIFGVAHAAPSIRTLNSQAS